LRGLGWNAREDRSAGRILVCAAQALLAFLFPIWLLAGKARLKHEIALRVDLDVRSLPYDIRFLEYLQDLRADRVNI